MEYGNTCILITTENELLLAKESTDVQSPQCYGFIQMRMHSIERNYLAQIDVDTCASLEKAHVRRKTGEGKCGPSPPPFFSAHAKNTAGLKHPFPFPVFLRARLACEASVSVPYRLPHGHTLHSHTVASNKLRTYISGQLRQNHYYQT